MYSILYSRDASNDTFARLTHIFEAALSCHVAVLLSTDPSQKFPRKSLIRCVYPRDSLGVKIHVHPPADHPLVSAEDSFCGEFVLQRIRFAEDAQSRKRAKRRSRFRELHSQERERERVEPREGTKCVAVRGRRSTASNARSGFHLLRNIYPPLSFWVVG